MVAPPDRGLGTGLHEVRSAGLPWADGVCQYAKPDVPVMVVESTERRVAGLAFGDLGRQGVRGAC